MKFKIPKHDGSFPNSQVSPYIFILLTRDRRANTRKKDFDPLDFSNCSKHCRRVRYFGTSEARGSVNFNF
ncbi:hypothetical protein L6452_22478 [Arctium lappa]|uniref:Uncharacterized protein n=1 Tax=Arctium lappa TaxID=4217 RepID=A0ACB9B0U1_ARCLA|nr:hypothetical protein L6452_22478 [Arctium lappa]